MPTPASTSRCRPKGFRYAAGAVPVGGNVRVSQFTWDPDQSQQKVGGITQYACAGHADPCRRAWLHRRLLRPGDLRRAVYTFAVSTHYPSATVTADDGGPVYYQNQVLGIVPRATFGSGY